jgi:hypothetical protein
MIRAAAGGPSTPNVCASESVMGWQRSTKDSS